MTICNPTFRTELDLYFDIYLKSFFVKNKVNKIIFNYYIFKKLINMFEGIGLLKQ